MVRYSFSLLWVSTLVEVRKGGKRATRVKRERERESSEIWRAPKGGRKRYE